MNIYTIINFILILLIILLVGIIGYGLSIKYTFL